MVWIPCVREKDWRAQCSRCLAEGPERVPDFPAEYLGLLPRREVAAGLGLAEIDQLVIGLLGPTPWRNKALAGKRRHSGRDRDVGGQIEVGLVFPVQARRGDRGVG